MLRFRSLRYAVLDFLYSLMRDSSRVFVWSNIGSLGKSYIGRMTLVMPLIGYLVIFNPSFVSFFQSEIPGGIVDAPSWLSSLHSRRLSFLYFGLLFVGCGMGLYILAAPEQIRRFPNASDYILEMEKVWSPALVWTSLITTIERSRNYSGGTAPHAVYCVGDPSFPDTTAQFLNDIIASAFKELESTEILEDLADDELEGTMVEGSPYFLQLKTGHIMTNRIMDFMTSGSRICEAFNAEMKQHILAKRKEVFFVEHGSLNFERYSVRLFIAAFYLVGIALLLIPTITTSILVMIAT